MVGGSAAEKAGIEVGDVIDFEVRVVGKRHEIVSASVNTTSPGSESVEAAASDTL